MELDVGMPPTTSLRPTVPEREYLLQALSPCFILFVDVARPWPCEAFSNNKFEFHLELINRVAPEFTRRWGIGFPGVA